MTYAHARAQDPSTSHQAAATIDGARLRPTAKAILEILKLEPMTDEELNAMYSMWMQIDLAPKSSPQNVRTVRKHLHDQGLVYVVGLHKTASGRNARLWRTA